MNVLGLISQLIIIETLRLTDTMNNSPFHLEVLKYTRKHPKDTNGRIDSLYNSVLDTLKVEKLVNTYSS